MAIVPQGNLFSWKEIEAASDLVRLEMVLSVIPDEPFMRLLEERRGRGRNDDPVRAMWNALIAGIVFQHRSAASLIRELRRNREMADRCGFDPVKGLEGIPSEDAFGRFLARVVELREHVLAMFEAVVRELARAIPDLGTPLAMDSKALPSFGKPVKDPKKRARPDGRRDTDGTHGKKEYRGVREDGTMWTKVVTWYGYKVHLVVDSRHEMPLHFSVSDASRHDLPAGRDLMRSYRERLPEVASRAKEMAADRGYDSGEFNAELYDEYGIRPVIQTRRMWKEEATRALFQSKADTILYDEMGRVSCECPWSGEVREMSFSGFEKERKTLKYRCPAAAYDLDCAGRRMCERGHRVGPFGRVVRVPLDLDRRIFTPTARSSYKWTDSYALRTAVERVFSRLDRVFCFEDHTIRGRAKMETRVGLAFLVQVCMALGRIRLGPLEALRSMVTPLARAA